MPKNKTLRLAMQVDTQKVKQGMDKNIKEVRRFKNETESMGTKVYGAFKRIGAGAIAAAAAIAGMSAGSLYAARLAGDAEQVGISFEVLLGSASKAKKVMQDLTRFAASTPFEFPELANSARNLIAFGVETKKLMPTLKSLGEISAGLKIPYEELSEIYGKILVQGRVFAEDINQLQGRGIPISQALAKNFGTTAQNIREMVSAGKIAFPDIERAFESLTGKGGKFFNLMSRQSKSLLGLWSTLRDNFNLVLVDLGNRMMPAMKAALEKGIEFLGMAREKIQDFFHQNRTAIRGYTAIAKQLTRVVYEMIKGFVVFGNRLGQMIVPLDAIIKRFKDWMTSLGASRKSFLGYLITIEFVMQNWRKLVDLALSEIRLSFEKWWSGVKKTAADYVIVITWMAKQTVSLAKQITDNWWKMFYNMLTNAKNIGQNWKELLAGKTTLDKIWEPLGESLTLHIDELPKLADRHISETEKKLTMRVAQLKSSLAVDFAQFFNKRMKELLPSKVPEFFDRYAGYFKDMFNGIVANAENAWSKLLGFHKMVQGLTKPTEWRIVGDGKQFGSKEALDSALSWRQQTQNVNRPLKPVEIAAKQLAAQNQMIKHLETLIQKVAPVAPHILNF